jgi:hypothetical protein
MNELSYPQTVSPAETAPDTVLCEHCNSPFTRRTGNGGKPQRFCSPQCRHAFHAQREQRSPTCSADTTVFARSLPPLSRAQGTLQQQPPERGLSFRSRWRRRAWNQQRFRKWLFRELGYYGFIRMLSPGCLGVDGMGKAPHWRLTEEWHGGQPPTREFLNWDGEKYRKQKSLRYYLRKKQNPVPNSGDTPSPIVGTYTSKTVSPKVGT